MQDRMHVLREVASQVNMAWAGELPTISAVFEIEGTHRREYFDIEQQMGVKVRAKEDEDEFMSDYFQRINTIKGGISQICLCTDKLKTLRKHLVQCVTTEDEREISQFTTRLLEDGNKNVLAVKKALEALKKDNEMFEEGHPNFAESRIRENLHSAVTRKFRGVILEYQTVQAEYKQEVKNRVQRQIGIVYPEASPDEMNEMVESGDVEIASTLVKARMQGGHANLHNALSDIQEKYRDIQKLEKSVAELHQMFVDLATLVEAQGELLDQIEHSVMGAKDYTEKADKELIKARKFQIAANKRSCCLVAVIIGICLVVVGPLLYFFL